MANAQQPCAAVSEPVLMPTMPSEPTRWLKFATVPATGICADDIATMPENAGIAIAFRTRMSWSRAVLTVLAASPEGSV